MFQEAFRLVFGLVATSLALSLARLWLGSCVSTRYKPNLSGEEWIREWTGPIRKDILYSVLQTQGASREREERRKKKKRRKNKEKREKQKKRKKEETNTPPPHHHRHYTLQLRKHTTPAQPHAIDPRPFARLSIAEVEISRLVPAHDARTPDAQRREAEGREHGVGVVDRAIIDMADWLLQECPHGAGLGVQTVLVELESAR